MFTDIIVSIANLVYAVIVGMNIFVAFFVLLLLLADSTPQAASSIPLIGKLTHISYYIKYLLRFNLMQQPNR